MLTAIITIILVLFTVYAIMHKKYLEWFFAIYVVMPDYYALDIRATLPLLTASRILIIVLGIYYIFSKKNRHIITYLFKDKYVYIFLMYFLLRLIPNLFYCMKLHEAWNEIGKIIFEQLVLIIIVCSLVHNETKIIDIIKSTVYCSGVVFLMGIFESIFSIKIGSILYTASRDLLDVGFERMGLLRTTVTFGLPGFFSFYAVVMLPLILFLYEQSPKRRFIVILALDFMAIVHSGARSGIFAFLIVILLYFILGKKEVKKIFIKAIPICVMSVAIIVICASLINSRARFFYSGTAKSLLNEVGYNFDLSEGLPDGVEGYGGNEDSGTYSRIFQLSGITYTLKENPLFGLGAGAQTRGAIHYMWKGFWNAYYTYDVGYVAFIGDEGIIGFLGNMVLMVGIIIVCFRGIIYRQNKKIYFGLLFTFIAYYLCLAFTDEMPRLLWLMICLLCSMDIVFSKKKQLQFCMNKRNENLCSIVIITPGILPVPAVKGGAVEELITKIVYQNEKSEDFHIDLITIDDNNLQRISFNHTDVICVSKPRWMSFVDRVVDKVFRTFKYQRSYRFFDSLMMSKFDEKDYDIIIIENMISLYKVRKKEMVGKKVFFHMHNNGDAYRNEKDMKEFLKNGGHVITVSRYLENTVRSLCNHTDVQTLINCVDTNVFYNIPEETKERIRKEHHIENKDFVFLYSGRLIPEKGVLELVKAFSDLYERFPNSRLIISGCALFESKKQTKYQKEIYRISTQIPQITFAGFIEPCKMPEIYACADVVVIPSRWEEPFGMVALEALSMNIPIIATRSGGLTEILDDKCAIIIPNDDKLCHGLEKAMERVLEMSDNEIINMKKAAENRMREHPEFCDEGYLDRLSKIICKD